MWVNKNRVVLHKESIFSHTNWKRKEFGQISQDPDTGTMVQLMDLPRDWYWYILWTRAYDLINEEGGKKITFVIFLNYINLLKINKCINTVIYICRSFRKYNNMTLTNEL